MSELSVVQYYLNKRLDDLHKDMMNGQEELKTILMEDINHCDTSMETMNVRVGKLEGFKNRALGAVALILFLLGIWKVY